MNGLIHADKQLFLYLNNLGSPKFDPFWLTITHPLLWSPLFLLFIYLLYKRFKTQGFWYVLFILGLSVAATWGTSEIFKIVFQRIRPCADPEIIPYMRRLRCAKFFSFFSGHAGTSFCIAIFVSLVIKRWWVTTLAFLWAALISYSRIYIGVHFPGDILTGAIIGSLFGSWAAVSTLKYVALRYRL